MTDQKRPRAAGGERVPARHIEAPTGLGWDPIERCDWEAIAGVLPKPWPPGAQRQDLRYWAAKERRRSGNRPGYRDLSDRWGVTEKAARLVCADVEWWADARFGDEHPERATVKGSSRAGQGQAKGRPGADEGQTRGASDHAEHAVFENKGAGQGQAKGRPGADEGQARGRPGAPIDDRDRDTNNDTDRDKEHTSAPPPPAAGAAQLSLLSGAVDEVKAKAPKPTKAAREVEAAELLFHRLERLRLERYRRLGRAARGLSAEAWVPKLRKALAKASAADIEDGWVWLIGHPDAAWHRGEDRGGSDRCTDYAMLLARPDVYASRRTWAGPTGLTTIEQEEAAAWLASGGRSADAPAWRERMRAAGVQPPSSQEEDDALWNRIGSAGRHEGDPSADDDDGYVCPF